MHPTPSDEDAPTRWSRIEADDLEHLVDRYWKPIHRFLRHRLPVGHDAEDETQTFFLRFLERSTHARAERGRGRFRVFLYHVARQYLYDCYRRAGRTPRLTSYDESADQGRGGGRAGADDPAAEFDRAWVRSLVNEARRRVKADLVGRCRAEQYHAFHLYYFGDEGPARLEQKDIADRLSIPIGQVNNHVSRTRPLFAAALRDLVAASSPADAEAELADVRRILDENRFDGLPPTRLLLDEA